MAEEPVVTAEMTGALRRDGFYLPVDVLSPEEVVEYRDAILEHLRVSERAGGLMGAAAHGPKIHLLWSWADRLVRHPRLLRLAVDLLGPDVLVWSTSIFVKEPGGTTDLAWHQDAVSYDLDGCLDRAVRVWLALTPTTVENGTLRFALGSHLGGALRHKRALDDAGLARGDAADVHIDPADRRDVLLAPGQCSVHNLLVVHGSGVNHTDAPRISFAIDYLATSVRPHGGNEDCALLVAGQDSHGNFRLEIPAGRQPVVAGAAQFRRSVLARMSRLSSVAERNLATGLLGPSGAAGTPSSGESPEESRHNSGYNEVPEF
jgi:non-haem Fe2+, alpha-ketoglutarate-dependent halogenase